MLISPDRADPLTVDTITISELGDEALLTVHEKR